MMNILQRSILIGSEVFVSIHGRFTPKPDEPPQSTPATPPKPKGEVAESPEPTHPVWNGELDEPIWW
jgi:hypothetical protein